MTKGEAIRIVEGWLQRGENNADDALKAREAIKRLLQEVKKDGN